MKKTKKQIDEKDLILAIDNISKKLAYKFRFGYHNVEDMQQQISIFAIEGLEKYDYERPLENFLWTHVRNRLYNFKRDNYQRPDRPCNTCEFLDRSSGDELNNCTKFCDKNDCELYKNWLQRNSVKKNLMYLNTVENLRDYAGKSSSANGDNKELFRILDEELTDEARTTYLKIKFGSVVYKKETDHLIKKIKEILKDD